MNVRFGRKIVLLAAVSLVSPMTTRAAESNGPAFGTPAATVAATAADKAAEAQRLADQAAALAQRAAELAAESRLTDAATATPKQAAVVPQAPWSTRGAAEVTISDSEMPAAEAADSESMPNIGWRSHRAAPSSSVHFADASASAVATTPSSQSAAGSAKPRRGSDSPEDFELKLSEAAIAAADDVRSRPSSARLASTDTLPHNSRTMASRAASEPETLDELGIRLAAQIADTKVRTAENAEPMPTPNGTYDDRPIGVDGSGSCDCLDDTCCPPRPVFWTAGVEATFLRPDLNDSYAQFGVVEYARERFDEFNTASDDVDDVYLTPRLWLGVQGCLWGANVRYWHLRANEGSWDPTLGHDGEWDGPFCGTPNFGYNSCNDLEAYTVDFEITRRVCLYDCWMQFSAGVRYADIEQDAALSASALTDDSMLFSFADSHRSTHGTGIVLGWYGRRPIFPCSCVHWFYNFRWSALWGPTDTAADTGVLVALTSSDPDAVAAAGSVNGASTHVSDNLFIGEIQLGLEWDYALRCLPANSFFRVAVEYQRWTGGTGYSAANSFAGVEIDNVPTTLGDAVAIADTPELDLVGLTIGTGLTW